MSNICICRLSHVYACIYRLLKFVKIYHIFQIMFAIDGHNIEPRKSCSDIYRQAKSGLSEYDIKNEISNSLAIHI